jgi:acyl carrier protein
VVREDNAAIDEASVVEHVRRHAGARKVPRRVYFVERLPRTESGKLLRNALAHLATVEQSAAANAESATAEGIAAVAARRRACRALGVAAPRGAVGRDDDFFLLGGDSLRGMQLIGHVNARFGVELSIELLFGTAATVAGMARAIEFRHAAEALAGPS